MRMVGLLVVLLGCGSSAPAPQAPIVDHEEKPATPEPLPGIDAMPFLTKASFRPELPANAPPGLLDKVTFESIRLLDPEIGKRASPDLLRAVLELCITTTIASVGLSEKPVEVRIHFTTNAGKNTVRVDTKGSPDGTLVGYIHQDLGGMPPLGITGELGIQIHAKVAGGSTEPWVAGEAITPPVVEGVYIPAKDLPPDPPSQKAKMLYLRLITPEDDLAKRTTPQALLSFIEAVQAQAETTIATSPKTFELTLEMHCTPTGHTMQIGFTGTVDAGFAKQSQALSDAVKALPKLATTGDIDFVIGLTIN